MNPTSDLMGMIQVRKKKKIWDKNRWNLQEKIPQNTESITLLTSQSRIQSKKLAVAKHTNIIGWTTTKQSKVWTTNSPHYYRRHKKCQRLVWHQLFKFKRGDNKTRGSTSDNLVNTAKGHILNKAQLDIDIIKTSNNIKFGAAETISNWTFTNIEKANRWQ